MRPIKNWEDERAYDFGEMDMKQWAWEFVRRNPRYQKAYAAIKKLGAEKYDLMPSENVDGLMEQGYWSRPKALPGESCLDYHRRCPDGVVKTPLRIFRDTWRLRFPKSPYDEYSEKKPPVFLSTLYKRYPWERATGPEKVKFSLALAPNVVVVKFALDQDFDTQLSNAKTTLEALHKKFVSAVKAKNCSNSLKPYKDFQEKAQKLCMYEKTFPQYLRLLDSILAAKATKKQIGALRIAKVFEGEKTASTGIPFDNSNGWDSAKDNIAYQRKRAIALSQNYSLIAFFEPKKNSSKEVMPHT